MKPSNLFLTHRPDGSPLIKVLDFGIAKLLADDPSKPKLTANGAVLGSPLYMAPEQILGSKGLDARADVWALGVILFELLSGKPPFDGNSFTDIIIAIGTQPPPSLRGLRPEVPAELEAIVGRCLEKDPQKRMPDVAALATALLPFVMSRRSHVVVENIVTMLHGAEAAEKLPRIRPTMTSGQSFGSTPAGAFAGSSGSQPAAAPSVPSLAGGAPPVARPGKGGATLLMTGSAPPAAVSPPASTAPGTAGRAAAPLAPAASRSAQATMPGTRAAAGNDAAVDSVARPPMVKGPPWILIGLITAIVGAAVTFGVLRALGGDGNSPAPAPATAPGSGRPL
jgi:serine/threonine-protein kinase